MYQLATILFWISFCGLLMASVVYAIEIIRRQQATKPIARVISVISWISLTASIGLASVYHGGTPLTGPNTLVLLAWALVIVYFVFGFFLNFNRYGAVLVPVAATLLFVAQIMQPGVGNLAPYPDNFSAQLDLSMIGLHVFLITFANALLLVGSIAAALYLYQAHALSQKKTNALLKSLPPLANIEKLWVRVLSVGLPIYFAALALGVTHAITVDAQGWLRIALAAAILVVFSTALCLYYRGKTDIVLIARLTLVGAALVVLLMVLARALPTGFQIFGAFG
ncbi:MAG: cytochrome c biogenesis protein CcsA [Coriobacteriia bacterium]|nr:cytochrome c biogenesis protein CcsA [Coriobacteriia bacterium]